MAGRVCAARGAAGFSAMTGLAEGGVTDWSELGVWTKALGFSGVGAAVGGVGAGLVEASLGGTWGGLAACGASGAAGAAGSLLLHAPPSTITIAAKMSVFFVFMHFAWGTELISAFSTSKQILSSSRDLPTKFVLVPIGPANRTERPPDERTPCGACQWALVDKQRRLVHPWSWRPSSLPLGRPPCCGAWFAQRLVCGRLAPAFGMSASGWAHFEPIELSGEADDSLRFMPRCEWNQI